MNGNGRMSRTCSRWTLSGYVKTGHKRRTRKLRSERGDQLGKTLERIGGDGRVSSSISFADKRAYIHLEK